MIYLSKLPHSDEEFYLRILKDIHIPSFELDEDKPPVFLSAKNGEVSGHKKTDVLEVWVKPVTNVYPSVISPEKAMISKNLNPAKKVIVKLMDSSTKRLYEMQKIRYDEIPVECYVDRWPEKPNED